MKKVLVALSIVLAVAVLVVSIVVVVSPERFIKIKVDDLKGVIPGLSSVGITNDNIISNIKQIELEGSDEKECNLACHLASYHCLDLFGDIYPA